MSHFLRQWHVLQIPEFYRDALSQFFVRLLSEMQIDDSRTPMLLRYRLQEMLLVAGRVGHLADIALSCGFSDSNYFKDCFKRRYGVSPRAYRTRAQGR